ncbi:MAG TPA: class I SAM-dependent methyltransferase [Mycobacteriales bacterium]|nr:class I SAM-dependent methyltransferase [Mycobacteriales bacterium]
MRRTDPRIAAHIHAAFGNARTVINVGAGAGSYEPADREVTAVEPSAAMRAQRPPHRVPAIDATAEDLPFADGSFDAAMATITVHQWRDRAAGLRELRRVTRGPLVILILDPDVLAEFWMLRYIPEMVAVARRRDPTTAQVVELLGDTTTVTTVPIPFDCEDGFLEAFYGRPELILEEPVRRAQSGWRFLPAGSEQRAVDELRADLESGEWDRKYGELRTQPEYVGSLRLLVAHP